MPYSYQKINNDNYLYGIQIYLLYCKTDVGT